MQTIDKLDAIILVPWANNERGNKLCVMEAVAWIAGEPHSDRPQCACPIITRFLTNWNDGLPTDEDRDRLLKPLIPLVINTRSTQEAESTRSQMVHDWFITVYAPTWLDLAGLSSEAQALRDDPPLATCQIARAEDAARSAAWDAARAAAGIAAWDVVGDAAWDVAGVTAWDAARSVAWSAGKEALASTIAALQESAVELVKRMVAVGK